LEPSASMLDSVNIADPLKNTKKKLKFPSFSKVDSVQMLP